MSKDWILGLVLVEGARIGYSEVASDTWLPRLKRKERVFPERSSSPMQEIERNLSWNLNECFCLSNFCLQGIL